MGPFFSAAAPEPSDPAGNGAEAVRSKGVEVAGRDDGGQGNMMDGEGRMIGLDGLDGVKKGLEGGRGEGYKERRMWNPLPHRRIA